MLTNSLSIEPMDKSHDRTAFSCGAVELDSYIKERAGQDLRRRTASVFVAIDDNKVVGFYTLSATSISRESLPSDIIKKLPKYPIPAALLGRLAADVSYQSKGVGKALLINAMKRVLIAGNAVGIYALVVDAKNEVAFSFYKHFGFVELVDNPMRLFLPLATIVELMEG